MRLFLGNESCFVVSGKSLTIDLIFFMLRFDRIFFTGNVVLLFFLKRKEASPFRETNCNLLKIFAFFLFKLFKDSLLLKL